MLNELKELARKADAQGMDLQTYWCFGANQLRFAHRNPYVNDWMHIDQIPTDSDSVSKRRKNSKVVNISADFFLTEWLNL